MAAFRVVLDACVMLPQTLNDLLLTLADAELYAPIWTPDLLAEVERNLHTGKFGKSPQQAARRVEQMRAAFPFAEEEARGYESLIPAMTNDPKDRHVLAAAVRANAELIVTANLKDFPAASVEPYNLKVISPDEFLWDLFDLDPDGVLESMQTVVTRNRQPPRTLGELLESLEKLTPRFVTAMRASLRPHDDDPITGARPTPALPELSEAQIAALPAEHRTAYLTLRGMVAPERTRFLDHAALARLAFDVLTSVCVDGDLRTVWPLFDPDFRTALAGQWVRDNARDLRANGWDGDAVAAALADAEPDHPLWVHFERVHVRGFRTVLPDPKTWGIGEATRMVAPGLELLYLHSPAVDADVWQPDEQRWVYPILMHLIDGEWRVRNLGSDQDPTASS